MKMDMERIGTRHRDNSHHFAAESEALDQIAREVMLDKTQRDGVRHRDYRFWICI